MLERIPPKVARRVGNWCEESVLREVHNVKKK